MKTLPVSLVRDKLYFINYIVYLNEKDQREFIYLAVRHDNLDEFKKAVKTGSFEASDYGVILESGTGYAPDNVKEKMKILYNCSDEETISVIDFDISN